MSPVRLDISRVFAPSALFLKQKFVNVSSKSENTKNDNIVIVSFFFNSSPLLLEFQSILA
jgi:hypothetical protein